MTTSLPVNSSLENLKKQAKTLRRAWLAGDPHALQRIRARHPQFAHIAEDAWLAVKPRLTDCQLVLAREAGFDSWPQLRVAVETANLELPEQFVSLSCLCHDDPHHDHRTFHTRAHEMLQAHPWLAAATIWSAATAGNVAAVRAFLDENPALVSQPGPHGWVPLICACYSRVTPVDPAHSTFEVAKLLLDRGADPNAYTLKGNADERLNQELRRFTTLTSLFGGGSTGLENQPPHPHGRELAELLLERGADPAEEMGLWINQNSFLELLLRYGLKPEALTHYRTDHRKEDDNTLMGRALWRAANRGNVEQVKLLLTNGARRNERFEGQTPWERAMREGYLEIAHILKDAGAITTKLSDVEEFVSLCMAGEERSVRAMLEEDPSLIERAPKNLVGRAVHKGKAALNLILNLGFDPNWLKEGEDNAPIHRTSDEEIIRILLRHGASLKLRGPWYDETAISSADFFHQIELRDKLLNEPEICIFDALQFDRLDRIPDILARDPEALERPFAKCITREPHPEDWQTPLVRMVNQGKIDAVRVLLEHGADATACHPDGRTLLQLAHDKGFQKIAELLENTLQRANQN